MKDHLQLIHRVAGWHDDSCHLLSVLLLLHHWELMHCRILRYPLNWMLNLHGMLLDLHLALDQFGHL